MLRKIVTCLVAGLVLVALFLFLGNSGTISWFPPVVVFSLAGISLLLAILFPFAWQALERRNNIASAKIYGFLYALIRYCIAFNVAGFGWKKILGLQFVVPEAIAAQPMNQQSGEWLTWYYFGYSFAFGFVIAAIQVGGAYLLMFRRTLLPGAIILFALMFNLLLVNIFYNMNAGALIQSVILTAGIFFLLMLHYKRLIAFFLETTSALPSLTLDRGWYKNIARISVFILSLLFTVFLKSLLNQ